MIPGYLAFVLPQIERTIGEVDHKVRPCTLMDCVMENEVAVTIGFVSVISDRVRLAFCVIYRSGFRWIRNVRLDSCFRNYVYLCQPCQRTFQSNQFLECRCIEDCSFFLGQRIVGFAGSGDLFRELFDVSSAGVECCWVWQGTNLFNDCSNVL